MPRFLRLTVLAVALLPTLRPEPAPIPPELDEQHRLLIGNFRGWLAEVVEIEKRFQGSLEISTGPFLDLGKVEFIVRQTRYWPRKWLHHQDHNLIFSAVRGQDEAELERNLPAIINYVQLATAARNYHFKARHSHPLVGKLTGFEEVEGIARRVYDFRNEQLDLILNGKVDPSRVLTRENLGELGEPNLLPELRRAYGAGQDQVSNQRNAVVLAVLAVEIGISFGIAMLFLRRRRPATVIRLRAQPQTVG
ncbi:MAG: hypothetical protein GC160_21980 [Acidobacteria bacterium]|nr:hypothetical protein [Acidobacteriota bacterium]